MPVYDNENTGSVYKYRSGANTTKPYMVNTHYVNWLATVKSDGLSSLVSAPSATAVGTMCHSITQANDVRAAVNQMIPSLVEQARSMELGIAAATIDKSLETFTNRAMQFYRVLTSIKKGNLKNAAQNLGLQPEARPFKMSRPESVARRFSRTSSGLWLEYSYGWKPGLANMAQMINNIADVVNNVPPRKRITAMNGGTWEIEKPSYSPTYQNSGATANFTVKGVCHLSADLPNYTRLGFNPAEMVWEWVPFSFVADWFGQFNAKLMVLDPHIRNFLDSGSWTVKGECTQDLFIDVNPSRPGTADANMTYKGFVFTRSVGITPTLAFNKKLFKRQSATRALHAAALLSAVGFS